MKAYTRVPSNLYMIKSRKYLVNPNFDPNYGTGEDEDVGDDKMGCKYDDEADDMLVTQVDKDNSTVDEGIGF